MQENLEIIRGTVLRIVFSSVDTGYTVLELENGGFTETCVGNMAGVMVGEELEVTGRFIMHSTYGSQFKVESYLKTLPSGSAAILRYLSSGIIKGIGPATAKRIVQFFGDETFDIMEKEPEKIATIKGISLQRAREIQKEVVSRKSLRELCLRLSQYGLDTNESVTVFNALGDMAVEKVLDNPYILCRADMGFSFERVDEIAEKLNVADDNLERICAGVMYVVHHNHLGGHTCLPRKQVVEITAKMLDCGENLIDDAIEELISRRQVAKVTGLQKEFIAETEIHESEKYIAKRLLVEKTFSKPEKAVTKAELDKVGKGLGIELEALQRDAVISSVSSGVFILTGGPGTGKTTTVNSIIRIFENRKLKVALAAPTGRAAKRMTELTGREAKTIHRLLEVGTTDDGKQHIFTKNERNPLDFDAIIVDEMSMVDITVFEALLKAVRMGTRLVLVGDADQLPSVGAGNVLKDLIDSNLFECIQLKKVFRQAQLSTIVVNAHKIIDGEPMELENKNSDFFMLEQKTSQSSLNLINDLYCRRLPYAYGFSPTTDIQVLCPSKKMELGTVNINNMLQNELNPSRDDLPEIAFKGFVLRKGDKVMQIKNNYDIVWRDDDGNVGMGVFNGDVGVLEDIDVKQRVLSVRFLDRVAEYSGEEVMQLELAYAITVHKSQGSEFPCVILPILDFPHQLKYRNLLYTAVTRAKKMLVVVGSREVLKSMAQNNRKTMRYTALKTLLLDGA